MGAKISDCGQYRYRLERGDVSDRPLTFVMLNPSTADADTDDPTIRRCAGFQKAWGFKGFVVVNLYAWRATKPADLRKAQDPYGPDNYTEVQRAVREAGMVVCGWGAKGARPAVRRVQVIAGRAGVTLHCLRETKGGHPGHPLYLPSAARPGVWSGNWVRGVGFGK